MGFFENVIRDITKPRPKFRKGDKVKHKLTKKQYIVMDRKTENETKFIYLISDGKTEEKCGEPMLERHYEPIQSNF